MEENIETFTVESKKEKFYIKDNSSGYKKSKKNESLSLEDLYRILTNPKNKKVLKSLVVVDSGKQKASVSTDDKGNLIVETNNISEHSRKVVTFLGNFEKIEKFDSNNKKLSEEVINHKDNTKRYTKFSKEGITVTTFFDNNEKIEKFDSNNKKLSEEVINHTNGDRKYVEFHKKGNVILEMQVEDNGKRNCRLTEYGKNGDPIGNTKEFSVNENTSFEDIKKDNVLGHKKKFNLNERAQIEKDFRNIKITTNINDIKKFNKSFKYNAPMSKEEEEEIEIRASNYFGYKDYDELKNNMSKDEELYKKVCNFILTLRNVEILKKNSSTIEKISKRSKHNMSKYSIKIGEETFTFKVKEVREFDDKDKLRVDVCENGELKLNCDNMPLEPGKKYYYTIPNKDGSIYLFDDSKGEHHSNFKWDKERNPNFSVVAAGYFILDDNCKIIKITNDSGHFKPTSRDSAESFLRTLSKNMVSSLVKKGLDVKSKSIENLLSKCKKIGNEGYNISIDTTKCETNLVTMNSDEPEEAITIISKRRLDLIDKNAQNSVISRMM